MAGSFWCSMMPRRGARAVLELALLLLQEPRLFLEDLFEQRFERRRRRLFRYLDTRLETRVDFRAQLLILGVTPDAAFDEMLTQALDRVTARPRIDQAFVAVAR